MHRRLMAALGAIALTATAFTPSLGADAGPTTDAAAPTEHVQEDFVLTSHDGTEIHYTLFRPAGADASNPVPMVFSSHGWGGSRTRNMTSWMDAGFGGLSFDQRGFGASGGLANVQDPELEARDVQGLLDVVEDLDWVMRDVDADDDGPWGEDDPTVFAIGGSYGGGYQTVSALTEMVDFGDTRFDALAPEITWYDLPQALGPQGVARSAWLTLLQAGGVNDTPTFIKTGYAWGASTGQWPDGTVGGVAAPGVPDIDTVFHSHGPAGFVEGGTFLPEGGVQLDIPALWRQGSSDTLFNLNEGLDNLDAMTEDAREGSFLIGYNGGHVLPTALPMGAAGGSDPCSDSTEFGSWTAMTQAFFHTVAAGEDTEDFLDHRYGIADMDGNCVWTDDVRSTTAFEIGTDVEVARGAVTTAGAGAPQYIEIFTAEEETVITGVPTLEATWYQAGVDQRVFFGLAKDGHRLHGSAPTDPLPRVMQHQMQPHLELLPTTGTDVTVELGAGGMTLAPGETVYLVVSPVADLFFGHGSTRTPGVVALDGLTVNLPVQDD